MNTLELQWFLNANNININNNNNKIMKVCAIDQLPGSLQKNKEYGFVINLSRSTEPGSHWCGLFIDKHRNATWLCSFGMHPRGYDIAEFIKRNCKHFSYNKSPLQQLKYTVCGMYAAMFIIHMMRGGTLDSFTNHFSKNLLFNDLEIQKMYQQQQQQQSKSATMASHNSF